MGSPHEESFCLACRWNGTGRIGGCESCGGQDLAELSRGALVALPAGHQPCAGCNALDKPLAFRDSIRLFWRGSRAIQRARCARGDGDAGLEE